MGVKKSKPKFLSIAVLGLLLVLALPVTAFGDKRRGRNCDWDRRDRKCGKFINCHESAMAVGTVGDDAEG